MQRGRLLCHLDGWLPAVLAVNAKTARTREGWGEPETDQVPVDYLLQAQAEMLVAGVSLHSIPVLFAGADVSFYEVKEDRELGRMIEAGVDEFWRCVESGTPPPPESDEDVSLLYARDQGATVNASVAIEGEIVKLAEVRTKLAALKVDEAYHVLQIKAHMGIAAELRDSRGLDVLATWRNTKPVIIVDSKKLRAEQPGIWEAYSKPRAESRQFRLKGEKDNG